MKVQEVRRLIDEYQADMKRWETEGKTACRLSSEEWVIRRNLEERYAAHAAKHFHDVVERLARFTPKEDDETLAFIAGVSEF